MARSLETLKRRKKRKKKVFRVKVPAVVVPSKVPKFPGGVFDIVSMAVMMQEAEKQTKSENATAPDEPNSADPRGR